MRTILASLLLFTLFGTVGCSSSVRTSTPEHLAITNSIFGRALAASDSVELSATGKFEASGASIGEEGPQQIVVQVKPGTSWTATLSIPHGAIELDESGGRRLSLKDIQGKIDFNRPVRVGEGEGPMLSISSVALEDRTIEAQVAWGRTILNLLMSSIFGDSAQDMSGLITEAEVDRLTFAFRPGAIFEIDDKSTIAIGAESSVESTRLNVKYDGPSRGWAARGSFAIQLHTSTVSQIATGDTVLVLEAADISGKGQISVDAEGSYRLDLRGDIPWVLHGVSVDRAASQFSSRLRKLEVLAEMLRVEGNASGESEWSLEGTGSATGLASVRSGNYSGDFDIHAGSRFAIAASRSADEIVAGITSLAPLTVGSARLMRKEEQVSHALAVRELFISSLVIRSDEASELEVGGESHVVVERFEQVRPGGRTVVLTGGAAGIDLSTATPWGIRWDSGTASGLIPAGSLAASDAAIRVFDLNAQHQEVGEVELRNLVFRGSLDQAGLLRDVEMSASSAARIEVVGLGSFALQASVGRVRVTEDQGHTKASVEDAQITISTAKWPALLKGKQFPIKSDTIKFGDGGDLSPIRNARNTGGTVLISDTPQLQGTAITRLPAVISIPFKYDNSHWKGLKKGWLPSDGTVTLAGDFKSAFNKVSFVESAPGGSLGTGVLRLDPGVVSLHNAQMAVEGTGNFRKVLGTVAVVFFGLTNGTLIPGNDAYLDLELSKLGELPILIANAVPTDIKIVDTKIDGSPAISINFNAVSTLR